MTPWEAVLPLPPYSVNKLFYRDGRIKRSETRKWEHDVAQYLYQSGAGASLKELGAAFIPEQHEVHVEIEVRYPRQTFITLANTISSKTIDVTNFEKPLVDMLFLPDSADAHIFKNFGFDDKFITRLVSSKVAYDEPNVSIYVKVSVEPRRGFRLDVEAARPQDTEQL